MKVPVLDIAGAPYELGLAHGKALAAQIAAYTAERVELAGTSGWTGREASRDEVMALAAACLEAHAAYSPRLFEELHGIAAGSGVSAAELIVAGGFTDFVDVVAGSRGGAKAKARLDNETDDCTAFLVPGSRMRGSDGARGSIGDGSDAAVRSGAATANGPLARSGALAQTWDMHESSAEHLVLLRGRPKDAPDFTVYSTAGCVGMIGMNEAGLCVGINNLLAADGRVGVTWPFAVRALLEQETTAAALRLLLETPLAGGHNYLILDAGGVGANVEAMPTRQHVTTLEDDPVVHANHCLHPETVAVEREREASSQANSVARQADAERLLDRHDLGVDDLKAVTADQASICRVGTAPGYVGTCGGVVMVPATGELWVVGGRPSEGEYQRYEVTPAHA